MSLSGVATSTFGRLRRFAARLRFDPHVSVRPHPGLRRLGSEYGGWTFVDSPFLRHSEIVSCGLGEDASFDVEFAREYDATVILVDPTPRAVEHFETVTASLGSPRTQPYSDGGNQPVSAYELTDIRPDQLRLIPAAVTTTGGPVRFFAPRNSEHVSHSVVNFQNGYSQDTPWVEVASVRFANIERSDPEAVLPLVKFDIEGAEIGVIPDMLASGITPQQVLVEYDELMSPSRRARAGFDECHRLLTSAGYILAARDGRSCFTYVHESVY